MANQIKKKYLGPDSVDGEKILFDNDEALRAKNSSGFATDVLRLDMNDKVIAYRDGMSPEEIAYQSDISSLDSAIDGHIGSVSDAHDASAISVVATGNISSTNVQSALEEIQLEIDGLPAQFVDVSGDTMSGALDMDGNNINGLPLPSASGQPLVYEQVGANSGVAPLNGSGKIDATYLPSYVDDVEEYADLASFPATGESGKIYVALDNNKTYRWSGSTYIEISPSEVNSVNGETGIVVLDSDDISEGASNLYFTDARARSASVQDQITDGVTDTAPSQNAVFDALAGKLNIADFGTEFDSALATKSTDDLAEGTSNLYFTDGRAQSAVVSSTITNGVVDKAPSEDAVYDALALRDAEDALMVKLDGSRAMTGQLSAPFGVDASGSSVSAETLSGIGTIQGQPLNALGLVFSVAQKFVFQANIDMNNSQIVSLADGTASDHAINKGQLDSVESALDTRLDALEAASAEWATPYKRVLDATDISNGYIDLPHLAVATNGMCAYADRLAIHQGASEDYTLSVVGGVTRMTFGGQLVLPEGSGGQPLQEGDSIYVRYQIAP
jgi:hypothetical protein